jgi:hypothetical protein
MYKYGGGGGETRKTIPSSTRPLYKMHRELNSYIYIYTEHIYNVCAKRAVCNCTNMYMNSSEPDLVACVRSEFADFPYSRQYQPTRGCEPWRPDADISTAAVRTHVNT